MATRFLHEMDIFEQWLDQWLLSHHSRCIDSQCQTTVLPAKSDSDLVFCLQLLSKTLICTLHLNSANRSLVY